MWRDSDGYGTRVTRLRVSSATGWRFESSSAHRKALHSRAFRLFAFWRQAPLSHVRGRGNKNGNIQPTRSNLTRTPVIASRDGADRLPWLWVSTWPLRRHLLAARTHTEPNNPSLRDSQDGSRRLTSRRTSAPARAAAFSAAPPRSCRLWPHVADLPKHEIPNSDRSGSEDALSLTLLGPSRATVEPSWRLHAHRARYMLWTVTTRPRSRMAIRRVRGSERDDSVQDLAESYPRLILHLIQGLEGSARLGRLQCRRD